MKAAERYEAMTRAELEAHGIRVRKWRTSMSGVAWEIRYRDGRTARLIEAPRPKGPMSAAVFLHEVGHHAIGLGRVKPRCLEELAAWDWALEAMERWGVQVTDRVRRRRHESLRYAVAKAQRRGLKHLPGPLHPFRDPYPAPVRPTRTRVATHSGSGGARQSKVRKPISLWDNLWDLVRNRANDAPRL